MKQVPYRLYSDRLKQRFGERVHKVSLDAGLGCPNRGGGRIAPGCVFCDSQGSGATGIARGEDIAAQLQQGMAVIGRKYKARLFQAYFQPFSNTYAPVERLRQLYDTALAPPEVVGLAVGTRPDCLPQPVLELLAEYARRTEFWLELGLQSCHDATLERIRRGHDYACFETACRRARDYGLQVCVHVILGLPGESLTDMRATAQALAGLQVDGVKIHLLHVLADTELARWYEQGALELLSQQEYVAAVVDFIERLPATTLIHRLTGDGPRERLLGPLWSLKKWEVINAIKAEFSRRGSYQGLRA